MGFKDIFRRFKPAYSVYNFFKRSKLQHIEEQYDKHGLKKNYFEPISSIDFKDAKGEAPWLDVKSSKTALPSSPAFQQMTKSIQEGIIDWSEKGYAIIPNFFSEGEVDTILAETVKLVDSDKANFQRNSNKIMFAYRQSEKIKKIINSSKLDDILSLLLGKEVKLFQSINFFTGSQQASHSDSVHMTTFPLGYLIAVWIALEDIKEGSGVLHYYPGSHQLPYILTPDYEHGSNRFFLGANAYQRYEKKIQEVILNNTYKKENFLAKKGDILIWHANLLHGGDPITQPNRTRKSMVLHYYAKGVACYHEITQRPALIEDE